MLFEVVFLIIDSLKPKPSSFNFDRISSSLHLLLIFDFLPLPGLTSFLHITVLSLAKTLHSLKSSNLK